MEGGGGGGGWSRISDVHHDVLYNWGTKNAVLGGSAIFGGLNRFSV